MKFENDTPRAACATFLSILPLLIVPACIVDGQGLRGKDRSPRQLVLRAAIPLNEPSKEDSFQQDLELSAAHSSGNFHQDSNGFKTDYTMQQASIAYRVSIAPRDKIRLFGFLGVGVHDFVAEWDSSFRRRHTTDAFGVIAGVEGRWEAIPSLELYLRDSEMLLFQQTASSSTFEAGLDYGISKQLHLMLGFRSWTHRDSTPLGLLGIENSVKAEGIFLGASWRF